MLQLQRMGLRTVPFDKPTKAGAHPGFRPPWLNLKFSLALTIYES